MSTNKFVSRLADDVQTIIIHNRVTQAGDCNEEEYDRLFGNIQQVLPHLMDCLSASAQAKCSDILHGLHTDFDGTRGQALQLFGSIAKVPHVFMRADLV